MNKNKNQNDPRRQEQRQKQQQKRQQQQRQRQIQTQIQNQNDPRRPHPADLTKPHLRQFIGRTLLPSERPARTTAFWPKSETRLTREFKNQQNPRRK